MKDFDDFRNYINNNYIEEINDTVKSKIKEQEKEIDFDDNMEKFAWKIKTFSAIQTMELLKKYHEWLNS